MRWACGRPGCDFHLTGVCQRSVEFTDPERECSDYLAGRPAADPVVTAPPVFPEWTGDALGTNFVEKLALSTRPRVVLVAGRPDSGKTTLLTSQFLELERGRVTGLPGQFAGSYTLRGYERLTDAAFRWKKGAGPIVPHTGRGAERDPGWMHLAFRLGRGPRVRHLLLADLPGEVFVRWATESDALPPMGVTDVWVVVDGRDGRFALTRKAARSLMIRASGLGGAPVTVVLTKADDASAEDLEALRVIAAQQLPGANVDVVAAFPGEDATEPAVGVLAPMTRLLEPDREPAPTRRLPHSDRYADWFGVHP